MLWGRGEEMLLRKIAVVETTHTMTHVAALASGQEVATNPFGRRSKQTRCFRSKPSNARKANVWWCKVIGNPSPSTYIYIYL